MSALGKFLLSRVLPMVWVELKYTFEKQSEVHISIHQALAQWAQWAQTLDHSKVSSDTDDVPLATAAFAEDLITLHELWGDTLLDGPHQIWIDITAFTSSPFFVRTQAVTVKSLATESSNRSGLSSTPLSKISRDDPNTEFLAVLTVWPSRAFELHWRLSTSRRKRANAHDQFNGWVAQYELWNIECDDPLLVEDSRIPLDNEEVRLQYERFQKMVTSDEKPRSAQASSKHLALHFSSSISGDLHTITVLTTLFKRCIPMPSGLTLTPPADAMDTWRPIPMPIKHTMHATLLMGFQTATDGNAMRIPDERDNRLRAIRLDRTPAYRMLIYRDYVLYQSIDGQGALSEDEDMAGTVAVYRITNRNSTCSTELLGCIEGNGTLGSIHHAVFHPQYPLLAFQFLSRIGDSHIVLWCFNSDSLVRGDSFLLLNHEIFHSRNMKGGFSVSYIANLKSRLKYLQFSACGMNIVYQVHNKMHTYTEIIEGCHVYNMAREQFEKEQANLPSLQSKSNPAIPISALEKASALPNYMALDQPVLHNNGSSTKLSFDPGAANRDIKIVHSTDGRNHEQSLLSLPAWNDVKSVSVSVRMPSREREDKITVILNKMAKPFYVIGGNGSHTAPAVVRKNVQAIAKSKTAYPISGWSGKAETSTCWSGIGLYDKEADNADKQDSKRIRYDL